MRQKVRRNKATYTSDTKVFNGGYFMACRSTKYRYQLSSPQNVVSCSFQVRTSEIELALFEWIEVGEGRLNQVCRETHNVDLPAVSRR